jgi:hypothetical protein
VTEEARAAAKRLLKEAREAAGAKPKKKARA